jgi:hypothetical protein
MLTEGRGISKKLVKNKIIKKIFIAFLILRFLALNQSHYLLGQRLNPGVDLNGLFY